MVEKWEIKTDNEAIVYSIARLYVLLNQYLTDVYSKFGLNPAKFNLLMLIKHKGGEKGIPQIELGNQLYVSAANITKLIDYLEKKKWVMRINARGDRRVKLIKITLRGSKLLDKVWVKHMEALGNLLGEFSARDKVALKLYLEKFLSEIETKTTLHL